MNSYLFLKSEMEQFPIRAIGPFAGKAETPKKPQTRIPAVTRTNYDPYPAAPQQGTKIYARENIPELGIDYPEKIALAMYGTSLQGLAQQEGMRLWQPGQPHKLV